MTAEQGTRVDAPPPPVEQKRPQGVDVVKEVGDRVVIEINNQIFVESSDRPRMTRGARDVYYEDLPRGRTRETVVREDMIRLYGFSAAADRGRSTNAGDRSRARRRRSRRSLQDRSA